MIVLFDLGNRKVRTSILLASLRVLKYSVSSLVKNVVWIDDLVKYIFIR